MQFFKIIKPAFLAQASNFKFCQFKNLRQKSVPSESDWSARVITEKQDLLLWKTKIGYQKLLPETLVQQINELKTDILQKLHKNSYSRYLVEDKLMAKAIYEANVPEELAFQYIQDVKARFLKITSNDNTMMIITHILKNKLINNQEAEDIKKYLRESPNFKLSIERLIIKSTSLNNFSHLVKLLDIINYDDKQMVQQIQEEIFKKKNILCQVDFDDRNFAARDVTKRMRSLKFISKYFLEERGAFRFHSFPTELNTVLYQCSLTFMDAYIKLKDEVKPENIIIFTSVFFGSKLCQPNSKPFDKLIQLTVLLMPKFQSSTIIPLMNFFIKIGCDRQYPLIKDFGEILIKRYEMDRHQMSFHNILTAMRASIYFELNDYLQLLVSDADVQRQIQEFKFDPQNQEQFTLFYQTMFKIPYYTQYNPQVDFKQFNNDQFSQELEKNWRIETDDICDYFSMMGIPFTKEVQRGAYAIDIYLPNLPDIDQVTAGSKGDSQVKFNTWEQQDEYIKQTKNENSIFIEMDGKNHFYDKNSEYYSGSCILKRDFLKKNMGLTIAILKHKDLNVWNEIPDTFEKSKALLRLIQQSI